MSGKKVQDAFNDQINAEVYSAYLYWSMSAYFESMNLKGLASWMRCQAQEEILHAVKFQNFINDRRGRVVLGGIDAPPAEWDSPLAAFEAALKHECMVSGRIADLVNLAVAEKDHAANALLQWFVTEQVEEEASADEVVGKLKLTDGVPGALLLVDQELGQRTFMPPPTDGKGADK